MAGAQAFREQYTRSVQPDINLPFESYEGRELRYSMYWASYQNATYRNINGWANALRTQYGLYRYIRDIYNPSFRLGEFYAMMVWGGLLDVEAGQKGAIPIEVYGAASEADLRPAIAYLWEYSNWGIFKSVLPLLGSVLGDVAIKICDDTQRQQTYMEVIHPSVIYNVELDRRNYVKAYEISESRTLDGKIVQYRETAEREGNNVVFKTYANNKPYPWDNDASSWSVGYGFIPLVMVQHRNVGGSWGFSEVHNDTGKIREVDDQASKLHDHIRKMVDPVWVFNSAEPKDGLKINSTRPTANKPEPGREEDNIIFVNSENFKMHPMVVPELDIEKVGMEIDRMLKELEKDYPELQMDIWAVGNDTSGAALNKARKRVEKKVGARRSSYDTALAQAQKMALSIAGMRNYPGFEKFDENSYKEGKLSHRIGKRDVFDVDPQEFAQEKLTFWQAVQAASTAGIPIEVVLEDMGFDTSKVSEALYANPPQQ